MPGQTPSPLAAARQVYRQVRQFPRIRKNKPFNGLAAGATGTVLQEVGETYLANDFWFTIAGANATAAQIIAQVTSLQCIIDGDTKIDITGEELVMLQRYYNQRAGVDPIVNGVARLNFTRPWHREITGEDDPAWGTADVATFEMRMALAGGATIDSVKHRRVVTDGEAMGRHLCLRRKPRPAPGATTIAQPERIDQWVNDLGTQLLAMHVKTTQLNELRLTVDSIIEREAEYNILLSEMLEYERVPQTANGYQHIDFTIRNRLKDALPMIAQTMQLDLAWTGDPGAYTWLMETIEGPVQAG